MSDGNVVVIPFKCSRRMKEDLQSAFCGRYTSLSEGVRGILTEWLVRNHTHTTHDAINLLEEDVKLIKEKLAKGDGGKEK